MPALLKAMSRALNGMGLAYVPLDLIGPHIEAGRLVPVLEGWWPCFPVFTFTAPTGVNSHQLWLL